MAQNYARTNDVADIRRDRAMNLKIKSPNSDCRLPILKRGGARRSSSIEAAPLAMGNGFTLLEVMFAVMAFCTATFAILALFSQSLANARRLERPTVDAGLVAAELSLTNQMVEGTQSGDLGDLLGDSYKGYTWTYQIQEVQTNKLFEADVAIERNDNHSIVSQDSFLFYRPDSPEGSLDGATVAR
jgi:hypothetical protein